MRESREKFGKLSSSELKEVKGNEIQRFFPPRGCTEMLLTKRNCDDVLRYRVTFF